MSLFTIVPIKPFSLSKSRLSSILSPDERAELSRGFLKHTLQVLANVPEVTQTLVISRDPAVWTLIRDYQVRAIVETGAEELNAALTQATRAAQASGAEAVLILPADLPLLSEEALQQLITGSGSKKVSENSLKARVLAGVVNREDAVEEQTVSKTEPLITIAPDRHEDGTNALLVQPPHLISYGFGEHSFRRHITQAERVGAQVRICRLPELALDVDTPEDLDHLRLSQRFS